MAEIDFPLPEDRVKVQMGPRTASVSAERQVLGAEGDAWVNRVPISAPRYVNGTDLSEFDSIRVNYVNSENTQDCYIVDSWIVGDSEIVFWWEVGPTACAADGSTEASVQIVLHDEDGTTVLKEFNSSTIRFTVRPSVQLSEETVTGYSDAVAALVLGWNEDVTGAVAGAQAATAAANTAASAADAITAKVEAQHDAAYEAAEDARQALYEAAEAGRDAASENQFTIRDGAYCITYEEE